MHKQHIYCMYHHTNLYSHLHAISWWVPRPGEVIVVVLCYWISYIEWDENNIVGANKKALNLDGWYIIWLENWRTSYGTTKDYNSSLIIKLLLSTAKERPHINTLVLYPFSILLLPPIPSSYQKYTPLKDNIKQHSIHIFCLLIIILTRHQNRLSSLPILTLQSSLAIPVTPTVLNTLHLGTFCIITFKDGGAASTLQLRIIFEFRIKFFVRDLYVSCCSYYVDMSYYYCHLERRRKDSIVR